MLAAAALPVAAQQGTSSSSAATAGSTATAGTTGTKHKSAHAGSGTAQDSSGKSETSYTMGVSMGQQLRGLGLSASDLSSARLAQGVHDGLSGKGQATPADQQKVMAYITKVRTAFAAKNEAAAKKFLDENAKEPGVQTLPSGLQYKVLTPGSGESPKPTDRVTVNYRGTLLDGTEFDSSYKHGQPATFAVNGVIKGWQQALVLMKPGAKWELFIPPDLAYGANPPPRAPIPPNALLKFQVDLLRVEPPSSPPAAAPGRVHPGGAGIGGEAPGSAAGGGANPPHPQH